VAGNALLLMDYRLIEYDEVSSTLDVAHELAANGAEAGTLIIANAQTAGRGRMGRTWRSEPGAGLWLTLIERPSDASALDVLSLRIGLALAPALDRFAEARVQLKWPNDLYVRGRKLGGILIEARWREGHPEWVAIGVGINLRPPASEASAIGLRADTQRDDVLATIAPEMRRAAAMRGALTAAELESFDARDLAKGRRCVEPVAGTVLGIDYSGALLVDIGSADAGDVTAVRAGSLVLEEAS
jgi:BirA family biotin operon repressor/biotin-[acetyl-CoA-carboxylase] ligase